MSRKKDPIVAVLRYFREASIEQAEMALTLAKDAVQERRKGSRTKKPAAPKAPPPVAQTAPATSRSKKKSPVPPTPVPPKNVAAQVAIQREADVPLPLSTQPVPDLGLPRK